MKQLSDCRLVVISHAGIKQINRAVYRELKYDFLSITIVVPAALTLSSGQQIVAEPAREDDPVVIPMALQGRNPRTYFYPDLISWLNVHKTDVVLLENDPVSRLGVQLSAWCRKNGARIICQTYENLKRDLVTTLREFGVKALPRNLVIHAMNARMASRTDALLVVNRDSEEIFQRYGYSNVCRIPLGYDQKVFFRDTTLRHEYRKKLAVSDDTLVIAYFGRLVRQKGVHLLIEALSGLTSMKWILLLDHIHDSEGSYASEIRRAVSDHGLDERVKYFEADHFEIANYMRAADIAVAPSITTPAFKEQYGRAVQEAMACGCVTLVSDSGHLKDIVGDAMLVFRENDPAAIRERIASFMQNPLLRQQYAQSLAQRANSHLTTEAQAVRLRTLIRGLLE